MNSLLIAKNILKRAFRNKKELIILTLLPVIIIGLMTFLSNDVSSKQLDAGYVDQDGTVLSSSLITHLKAKQDINLIKYNYESMQNALSQKKISFSFVIPEGFSQQIDENEKTNIMFFRNESSVTYDIFKQNTNVYISALYTINILVDTSVLPAFLTKLETPALTAVYSIAGRQDDVNLSSMGFVLTFIALMIFISMGTVLEDKKKLTLARIFSYPVKPWEIITGILTGSLVLGLMQLIPILFVLKITLNIPWGESFIGLSLILFSFLVTTIGLGIGLTGFIKNKFNPIVLIATIIVPTSILGGAFIPASMMPDIMNKAGYIVPQKWVMDSLEKVMDGGSINTILINLGIILLFGLAFATFGIKTLHPLNE